MGSACEGIEEGRNTASGSVTQKPSVSVAVGTVRSTRGSWVAKVFVGDSDALSWAIESQWVFPAGDEMITCRAGGTVRPCSWLRYRFRKPWMESEVRP